MRIPGGDHLTGNHLGAFLRSDRCAVRDLVALALATEFIHDTEFARARHGHQVALFVLHGLDVMEPQRALVANLDTACRCRP